MVLLISAGIGLVIATTLLHYEALRLLTVVLPALRLPSRAKLIVAVIGAFASHAAQIALYAAAFWGLLHLGAPDAGAGAAARGFGEMLYFSAETYTSVGYGDIMPPLAWRPLAGVEALNGLLLIGWTASYLYVEMQRFWRGGGTEAT